ncbi:MAG TPA: hypothetical protein VM912_00310 [Terriglobales bacterium]|nr:hypothetical protein [Terriglobales bacterium]
MPATLRPLSTGELLDKTFTLYRQNFPLFFGIAALPQIGLFILVTLMQGLAFSTRGTHDVGKAATMGIAVLVVAIVYLIGVLMAAGMIQGATTLAVSSLYLGEPTSVKGAYSRVRGMIGRTVRVMLAVGFRVGFGFLLFIIPGIIMLRRYSLAVPAAVLEKLKTKEALKRSRHLSEGSGGRVLLVYVLMLVLIYGVGFAAGWALGVMFKAQILQKSFGMQVVQQLISFLVGAAVGPVMTIAFSLLYYDQRVRKEAFDIEHMMKGLQPAGASSAVAAGATV